MFARFALAALPLALSLASCATSSDPTDELAGETADSSSDGKADGAVDGVYTYYAITGDTRKCAAPACGGMFLDRLNRSTTTCHDGSAKAACYTPVLDWSESGLSDGLQSKLTGAAYHSVFTGHTYAIVRGRFAKKNTTTTSPSLGRFVVTEAWVAEGDAVADGVFVKVRDNGVRCISAPCADMVEKSLNNSSSANIAAVDYAQASLSENEVQGFVDSIINPEGIIVAGNRYTVHMNGHSAKGRTATAAYHKLTETADCYIGGCANQVCSDQQGVITTCEWHDEYACYADATCERQADGACGWTATPELDACIADAQ